MSSSFASSVSSSTTISASAARVAGNCSSCSKRSSRPSITNSTRFGIVVFHAFEFHLQRGNLKNQVADNLLQFCFHGSARIVRQRPRLSTSHLTGPKSCSRSNRAPASHRQDSRHRHQQVCPL